MDHKEPRLTHQTLKVLREFMEQPTAGLAGSDIWKQTKIFSGTLYPILIRLENAGWLRSWWEEIDPREEGRPRKRLYQITGLGQQKANEAFADLQIIGMRGSWAY